MPTLIVDLPEETEQQLRTVAERRGISVVEYAREALAEAARRMPADVRSERLGPGRFAHLPGSVDDFLREKQQERSREAERDQ